MIKRLLRGTIRRTWRWLNEEPASMVDYAAMSRYERLNAYALEISEEVRRKAHYVWGVVHAVGLAEFLGLRRVSIIEFGVAGGNGLTALESIASGVEKRFAVTVQVYGFDTGVGLPAPVDYRDMPNMFGPGYYSMDVERLRRQLGKAELVLGSIENTLSEFIGSKPPPVSFIAFDLDLYSSTRCALALLESEPSLLLPRIHCYFDDILGYTFSDFTGERLAISDFNAAHEMKKISKIKGLRYLLPSKLAQQRWVEQFYLAHIFDHPLYAQYDGVNPAKALDLNV